MRFFGKHRDAGVAVERKTMSVIRATALKALLAAAVAFPVGALLTTPSSVAVAAKNAATKDAGADVGTPRRLRLLTTQQYINTIQYFFGPDIKIQAKFAPLDSLAQDKCHSFPTCLCCVM